MEPSAKEQENLSRLERAAQQTADPETLEQKAKKPEEKFRFSLR
ncbi:MAG: mechanosensitive ion channel family protein, partial [Mesorhizobium sp.]